MKKLLGLIAVTATATVALTACGEKVTPNVVVVTAEGSINDGTFNQGAYNGVKASHYMFSNVTDGYFEAKSGDAATLATAIQNQLDNGAETVVLPGFTHGTKNLEDMAKLEKNENKRFILIDSNGWVDKDENFHSLDAITQIATATYAIEQAAYMSGFMTHLHLTGGDKDKEVKYGVWGGMAFPSVYSFMSGFKQGAEDAAVALGAAATKANFLAPKGGKYYAGNFDQGGGKAIAESYLEEKADILLPVAGPQTKDAIDAIKGKSGSTAKVIGVDVDAKGLYSSDEAYILTSIVKNIAVTVADILRPVYGFGGVDYFGAGGDKQDPNANHNDPYVGNLSNGGVGYTSISGFQPLPIYNTAATEAKLGKRVNGSDAIESCVAPYATC